MKVDAMTFFKPEVREILTPFENCMSSPRRGDIELVSMFEEDG